MEMNGTTFYLMTNLDRKVAVCLCGLIEIGISGDVSLEEMVTMIQSIYKGED